MPVAIKMSQNAEIAKARNNIERLKQHERDLEERMRKIPNKTSHEEEKGRLLNTNFENIFYRDTQQHGNSYSLVQTNNIERDMEGSVDSDDDDESYDGRRRSRPRKTIGKSVTTGKLIDFGGDNDDDEENDEDYEDDDMENSEIMNAFDNDENVRHNEYAFESLQGLDLFMMNDIQEDNEEIQTEATVNGLNSELTKTSSGTQIPTGTRLSTNDSTIDKYSNQQFHSSNNNHFTGYFEDTDNEEVDKRNAVQLEIENNYRREQDLRQTREPFAQINGYDESSIESDNETAYHDAGDTREKIMREIEESKLRDMELHEKYKDQGVGQYHAIFGDFDEDSEHEVNNIDPRELIAEEIRQLQEREEELRINHYGVKYERYESDGENENQKQQLQFEDPRERIEHEIRMQQEREVEINQLHRTLSNENLIDVGRYDVEDDDDDDYNKKDNLDTRGKILREMEELRIREQEISIRQSYNDYDIIKLQEIEGVEVDEEEPKHVDIRDKIYDEINELRKREDELKKRHSYRFDETQSYENITFDQQTVVHEEGEDDERFHEGRGLKDTDKQKFGSRDDLVAFFGTHNDENDNSRLKKKTVSPKRLSIPKAFIRDSPHHSEDTTDSLHQNQVNSYKGNHEMLPQSRELPTTTSSEQTNAPIHVTHSQVTNHVMNDQSDEMNIRELYFHDEMKPMKESKKKKVLRKRSLQTGGGGGASVVVRGLTSQDVKKEEKRKAEEKRNRQTNAKLRLNVHPIAAKWERKGEEERRKQLVMEQEMQKRRDERAQYLAEKAEYERHVRLLEEQAKKDKQRKEEEMRILKTKQQGLNELWTSMKPMVTEDDNPDRRDQHLLFHHTNPDRNKVKTSTKGRKDPVEGLAGTNAIMKKIQRWERKIAKNTDH